MIEWRETFAAHLSPTGNGQMLHDLFAVLQQAKDRLISIVLSDEELRRRLWDAGAILQHHGKAPPAPEPQAPPPVAAAEAIPIPTQATPAAPPAPVPPPAPQPP